MKLLLNIYHAFIDFIYQQSLVAQFYCSACQRYRLLSVQGPGGAIKLPLFVGKTFYGQRPAVSQTFLMPEYLVSKQKIPKTPGVNFSAFGSQPQTIQEGWILLSSSDIGEVVLFRFPLEEGGMKKQKKNKEQPVFICFQETLVSSQFIHDLSV